MVRRRIIITRVTRLKLRSKTVGRYECRVLESNASPTGLACLRIEPEIGFGAIGVMGMVMTSGQRGQINLQFFSFNFFLHVFFRLGFTTPACQP